MPSTFTLIVHEPLAAIEPPVKEIEEPPAGATVDPPHVLDRPLGLATRRPPGRRSVNATDVSPVAFGFEIEKVRVV